MAAIPRQINALGQLAPFSSCKARTPARCMIRLMRVVRGLCSGAPSLTPVVLAGRIVRSQEARGNRRQACGARRRRSRDGAGISKMRSPNFKSPCASPTSGCSLSPLDRARSAAHGERRHRPDPDAAVPDRRFVKRAGTPDRDDRSYMRRIGDVRRFCRASVAMLQRL